MLQEEQLAALLKKASDDKERDRLEAERKALEKLMREQEEARRKENERQQRLQEQARVDPAKREELNRSGKCPAGFSWLKVSVRAHTTCVNHVTSWQQQPGGGWICAGGSHRA